ncbi:long-chain fatty acid transport protein 6-like [Saccoglossus kowalevskii]|uniref:Long-chain-fatty-acid--CoA ligase n=1 Tax=Saccoglossus kowalevskii TaxID=10224 RepID=A0ABM0GS76_SACKO|nr:PREDICTED: long-chain fatty acid transport protein 6-like [Saccoglossus kowalevskii]
MNSTKLRAISLRLHEHVSRSRCQTIHYHPYITVGDHVRRLYTGKSGNNRNSTTRRVLFANTHRTLSKVSYFTYPYWRFDLQSIRLNIALKRSLIRHLDSGWRYAEVFENAVKKYPDKPLLEFADIVYTYADLDVLSNKFANFAQQQGLRTGDTVAIMMHNEPAFLWTLFGLTKIGVKCAVINYNVKSDSLFNCLDVVRTKVVLLGAVCSDDLFKAVEGISTQLENSGIHVWEVCEDVLPPGGAQSRLVRSVGSEISRASEGAIPKDVRSGIKRDDVCLYVFTSGTSGNRPKAARVIHQRMVAKAIANVIFQHTSHSDRVYVCLPLYHGTSLMMGLTNILSVGATLILAPRFSSTSFWQDIVKYQATSFIHAGEICRYLLAMSKSDYERRHKLSSLMGNGLGKDIMKRFQERFNIPQIIEVYGATESTFMSINTDNTPGALGKYSPLMKKLRGFWLIKYDTELAKPVRDGDGKCVPVKLDEPGLLISPLEGVGAKYMGYEGDPEQSETRILRNVFRPGDQYYNTGDLFVLDRNYYLYFAERLGDTFRWKGENVATNEVANVIASFPSVREVVVYGVTVKDYDGRAGMAAIVLNNDADFNLRDCYAHITAHLPLYACPRFIRIRDSLELTETFKYKKSSLVKEGYDPNVINEPMYYMDFRNKTFLPLDARAYADIVYNNNPRM